MPRPFRDFVIRTLSAFAAFFAVIMFIKDLPRDFIKKLMPSAGIIYIYIYAFPAKDMNEGLSGM